MPAPSNPGQAACVPDLWGDRKNVGVSGPESFILDDSGGEEICSVAVPFVSAIVQGAAAAGPPARK